MNAAAFKTVFSSVRPARIAVLVDRDDPEWQETCRRIIEFLSGLWGGEHSIIVPTNGEIISPVFWELLDAFDPDYVCSYQKTWKDLAVSSPGRFDEALDSLLKREYSDKEISDEIREYMREQMEGASSTTWGISPTLEAQLKNRLAPFYFQDYVTTIGSGVAARSEPRHPYTSLKTILPHCLHPETMTLFESKDPALPQLWVDSITGALHHGLVETLESLGVTTNRVTSESSDLVSQVLAGGATSIDTPFRFSMVLAAGYLHVKFRDWEAPAVVVYGVTLDDFALYFALSRLRNYVYWLLPSWITEFETARSEAEARGDRFNRTLSCVNRFAGHVFGVAGKGNRAIEFFSVSQTADEMTTAMSVLDSARYEVRGNEGRGRIRESIRGLLEYPRTVFNINNVMLPTTLNVSGAEVAGYFPTPKPKGFASIVPYDHRWITELRVDKIAYPRHPLLGTQLVRHNLLLSNEARVSSGGLCYECPSPMYFGGDVDTILVRPEIYLPSGIDVFQRLAKGAGWEAKLSDKGFYSNDTVRKLGGLEACANSIRDRHHKAVFDEYLKEDQCEGTILLASDQRKYVAFRRIREILGSEDSAIKYLDVMLSSQVLHRGLILKCSYCRSTDWFSMAEVSEGFRCKRCRRDQSISSDNTHRPEPVWHYQLDEIVYQGLRNNMQIPLLALDHIRRKSESFLYADELEVLKPGEQKPFIEIDVCCISDGHLMIGEAKTTDSVGRGNPSEIKALSKYRDVALALGARQFLLATGGEWSTRTIENANTVFQDTGIEVITLTGAALGLPHPA